MTRLHLPAFVYTYLNLCNDSAALLEQVKKNASEFLLEQQAKSNKQQAGSNEQQAKSNKQGAKSYEQQAKSKEQREGSNEQ